MEEKQDYSALECVGIDKSVSAGLSHPGQLVFLFRRSLHQPREQSILYSREPVSIPQPQIVGEMKQLEGRIRDIEGSWQYKNLINYDRTELDGLKGQYAELDRLNQEMNAQLKPAK